MSEDWLTLADDERVVWTGRPRWSAALPSIAGGGVVIAGGVATLLFGPSASVVSLFAVTLVLAGVGSAVWGYLRVHNTRYAVTDRSLSLKRGVLSLSVTTVPRSKVQDSASSQSVTGRVFGYGTVSFETAGGDGFSFNRIDDPDTVRSLLVDAGGQRTLPGTVEEWRDVLSEVRALRTALEGK